MRKKIFLKKCNSKIYGWDLEQNLFSYDKQGKEKFIGRLNFDYDFCIKNDEIFSIRDRAIYKDDKKIDLDLEFPIKIQIINNYTYILDQENSSLFKYDSSFKLIEVYGNKGLSEFEDELLLYLLFPLDFDIYEEKIAILDIGNRRTILFDTKFSKKKDFPVVGKKVRFLKEDNLVMLFGEEIYKINAKNNEISKASYPGIIDFEVSDKGELFVLKEDI